MASAMSRRDGMTELTASVMHQLRRASQAGTAMWHRGAPDLTTPQFTVLWVLSSGGELDQSTLGALSSIDKSTIGPVLDRLEGRGLISKITDPANRRRRLIAITAAGRTRVTAATEHILQAEQWITDVLGVSEARKLADLLRALGDTQLSE